MQLSLQRDNQSFGITARKQAGESFCWHPATGRYGFNLWSIFLAIMFLLYHEGYHAPYLFHGQNALATSLFYRLCWKQALLFGEGGISFPCIQHGSTAFITGRNLLII